MINIFTSPMASTIITFSTSSLDYHRTEDLCVFDTSCHLYKYINTLP